MALTIPQYNAQIVACLNTGFRAGSYGNLEEAERVFIIYFLRLMILYSRLGATPEKEAMARLRNDILTRLTGHAPTADEIHTVINHWANDALVGSVGELT